MTDRQNVTIERLEEVLACFGGDAVQWPADERQALQALAGESDAAARLVEEAEALDRLLDMTAPPAAKEAAPEPLVHAIMADFAATRPQDAAAAAGDNDSDSVVVPFRPRQKPEARRRLSDELMYAAGGMAACFIVGLYLGVYGLGSWTLDPVESIAGLSGISEQSLDIGDAVTSAGLEEELL